MSLTLRRLARGRRASLLLLAAFLALLSVTWVVGPVGAQSPAATPAAATAPVAVATATPPPVATPTPPPPTAGPTPNPSILRTTAPVATAAGTTAAPAASGPAASGPAASGPAAAGTSASPSTTAAPCPNPTPSVTPTPAPGATPVITPHPNLCPAEPHGADPFSLIAWAFTPVFQALFMGLALFYNVTGDIGIAIILLTIVIRLILVPVFRAQIVSQRRMQMLQPELKAIQVKYKGNRAKISEEQMKLYKERGVNPASGCLPALLQMLLLVPMYQVFSQGLNAPNISSMLQIGGNQVINVQCYAPTNPLAPCINPNVPWLWWIPIINQNGFSFQPNGAMPANVPEIFINILPGLFGLSLLALVAAILQLIQTRMMATQSDDPQARSQQRIFLILPLFSLFYGWFLPAGLFIYWITTTIFSIVQQYLINGWGGLFPLFGWTPGFAKNHKPRFPVKAITPPVTPGAPGSSALNDAAAPASSRRTATDSAAGTIKPARGRSSRRGRRR
ncbi:MAG: YidC/Oxa1 family membrane protein insertase [Chloroflexota bacterium]